MLKSRYFESLEYECDWGLFAIWSCWGFYITEEHNIFINQQWWVFLTLSNNAIKRLIMPKESLFPETILSSSFFNDSFAYLVIIIILESVWQFINITAFSRTISGNNTTPPCNTVTKSSIKLVNHHWYKQMFISHQVPSSCHSSCPSKARPAPVQHQNVLNTNYALFLRMG